MKEYLTYAVDVGHALGSAAPLFGELGEMQELLDYLAAIDEASYAKGLYETYRASVSKWPRRLMLLSLPSRGILIDGEPVLFGFRYAVPILVYLLIHGPTTIEQLTAEVLTDKTPQRARNYFHQVRHRIQSLVPGVSIPFQADQKYYLQSSRVIIECDYLLARRLAVEGFEGLMQALKLSRGPFLADLEGEWVAQARERLRADLVTAGWRELSKPNARSNPQCIELIWRLLDIDPGNVDLGEALLDLYRPASGGRAADHVVSRLHRHYIRVLGEVPLELEQPISQNESCIEHATK